MSAVLFVMVVSGFVCACLNDRLAAAAEAVLLAGNAALEATFSMMGGFMLFGGIIAILEKAGAVKALVCLMKKPLGYLFGKTVKTEALEAISLNLAANMLGLGNAATPMGIKAAKLLSADSAQRADAALCLFLVINATSVQLYPTSVVALRTAAGSAMPEAVVGPAFAASAVSTLLGTGVCAVCERLGWK